MDNQVHIFSALGAATKGNNYPEGEKHAMLIFVCQSTNTEPDWEDAEKIAQSNHWNVDFSKKGIASYDSIRNKQDEILIGAYEDAIKYGSSLVVYTNVEN